jgi:hypothetical protein
MTTNRRREIHHGNDLYREIRLPSAKKPLKLTYWDLWIAIILVDEFAGDWDKLCDRVRSEKTGYSFRHYKAEELLNHLYLLRQALDRAGLAVDEILADAEPDFIKKQHRKARRKVLEMDFRDRERTPWMIHTPRKKRGARAMRGYWNRFPVSPKTYAGGLERLYKTSGWYSKNQTCALERKLSAFVKEHESSASLAELFALYRAFLTVVTVKMDAVDDSYGTIGTLNQEAFETYVQLDRVALDMAPEDLLQDLIEFMIWEDYAVTDTGEPIFFAGLAPNEVPLVESILRKQWHELDDLELDYHAEKALTFLGMLYQSQQMFDQFVPLAKAMGTRAWQRITTLSETAEKHGLYDLALAVYETCLGPGLHQDFLRDKYRELQTRLASS